MKRFFNRSVLIILCLLISASSEAGETTSNPIVELNSIDNKTDGALEICKGILKKGEVFFFLINQIKLKVLECKKSHEIKQFQLQEDTDYFIKNLDSQATLLRLSYSVFQGEQKKVLYILLERYAKHLSVSRNDFMPVHEKPTVAGISIDLQKLQEKGVLKKVLLKVTVDGQSFEKSTIEAVPVFMQNKKA